MCVGNDNLHLMTSDTRQRLRVTWLTGKETPRMQNMTTLQLDQLKRNTNLLHLEHIVELQVNQPFAVVVAK